MTQDSGHDSEQTAGFFAQQEWNDCKISSVIAQAAIEALCLPAQTQGQPSSVVPVLDRLTIQVLSKQYDRWL